MERRLAAILAADVVGYSRLMGEDEARTLANLKLHRTELIDPKISEHNGRIIKEMGDGLLVEFASVVDAVACAAAIQNGMAERNSGEAENRRIELRIGVNLGDVIVDEGDLFGDGVNVAARLEGLAEPGGICLSRAARDQVRDKLEVSLDDLGEIEVKNIRRPVRAFRVILNGATAPIGSKRLRPRIFAGRLRMTAMVAMVMVAGVALAILRSWAPDIEPASVDRMAFALPDKPSIAVLPFDNLSDDTEQGYFADGITEDLITDLSKISGLFVIARNSSFAYKGKQAPMRQVAEDLGVQYVLEGSVRRAGERVRINAQLIDATTGGHLWAERYDGMIGEVFAFQDQVTASIVTALAVNLTGPELSAQAGSETISPKAYDAFLRGWSHFRRSTPHDLAQAVSHFEHAIELDPGYGRAYAALAAVYAVAAEYDRLGATSLWSRPLGVNSDAAIVEMGRNLQVALKNPNPLAHQVASGRLSFMGQHDAAIVEAERALTLDPNDPAGHKAVASARIFAGRPSEAVGEIQLAMRLDPHYSSNYLFWLGLAEFGLGQFERAAEALEQASQSNPNDERSLIVLAATYGHLGRSTDGQRAIEAANRLRIERQQQIDDSSLKAGLDVLLVGEYSLTDVDWWPFKFRADRERLRDGLRLAGVPEAGADESVSPITVPGAITIDAALTSELQSGGATIVDVRGKASWQTGHIPGAIHLDFENGFTEENLAAAVVKDQQVIIHCSGPRCLLSSKACAKAVEWGFQQVYYFREGFPAWKAAGYPIEVSSE